ncbi:MAG: DUF1543 domain-containing protein [Rhizomicrobium sp.]
MAENKLFAVMLGGSPIGTGIEVHDVVFTVGPTIEDTWKQMLAAWFADGPAPHIDSWIELNIVDGMQVTLTTEPLNEALQADPDLWHVNLGYYEPGSAGFIEGHENLFVVASGAAEAKKRAKMRARRAPTESLHTDAVCTVSDRLKALASPFRICLATADETVTGPQKAPVAHDGYQPFSEDFLRANGYKK